MRAKFNVLRQVKVRGGERLSFSNHFFIGLEHTIGQWEELLRVVVAIQDHIDQPTKLSMADGNMKITPLQNISKKDRIGPV